METLFGHNGDVIRDEKILRLFDNIDSSDVERIKEIVILGYNAGINAAHEKRLEKRRLKNR